SGIHHQNARSSAGRIDQKLGREAALIAIVVNIAAAGCLQHKKSEAHPRLRTMQAAGVGCRFRSCLNGRKHTGPGFFKRTSLQYEAISRVSWVSDEEAQIFLHVGDWSLEPAV